MSGKPRDARLVVTLATIPSRIARLGPTIASLKAQSRVADRIYVCICAFSLREQAPYDVPTWLREDASVEIVLARTDYGPASKLLGMLERETDPSTRIVIVDDDWAYNLDMLEVLERRFEERRSAAIGLSGARLTRHWTRMTARIGNEIDANPQLRHELVFVAESPRDISVDILQYGFGAIVLRGWFDADIYDLVEPFEPLFFADDVLFSGYLEHKGIGRVCVSLPLPRRLEHWNIRPLHGDGRATRNYQAAIPALAARLGIWRPETLFDPRPPLRVVLKHHAWRCLRAARRVYCSVTALGATRS
jgi:hypothetical protein